MYEPQELSNIAWSFARLKVKDGPLIAAIASQSRAKLSQFTSLNISNTAWAFAVLSETTHLEAFLPLAARLFVDLAEESSVGTEWVDLVGVVERHRGVLEARGEVVAKFQRRLFLPALERLAAVADPAQERRAALKALKEFLDLRQLPHLGPLYTRRGLETLGWAAPAPAASWVDAARLGTYAAQGLSVGSDVRTERIVAWVAAALFYRDLSVLVPGRLLHAGVPPEADEDVRELLRPTFRHMARDDHAERVALLVVLRVALDACRAGTRALAELTGSVRLYVSHFPCLSCVAVLGQFARLFASATLEVAYDDAWEDG